MKIIDLFNIFTPLSAIAAWFSYSTSKASLEFQRNFAKNKVLISQIENSIIKLRTLILILKNPISDNVFLSYEPAINELQIDFYNYENRGLLQTDEIKITASSSINEINHAISRLETIIDGLL